MEIVFLQIIEIVLLLFLPLIVFMSIFIEGQNDNLIKSLYNAINLLQKIKEHINFNTIITIRPIIKLLSLNRFHGIKATKKNKTNKILTGLRSMRARCKGMSPNVPSCIKNNIVEIAYVLIFLYIFFLLLLTSSGNAIDAFCFSIIVSAILLLISFAIELVFTFLNSIFISSIGILTELFQFKMKLLTFSIVLTFILFLANGYISPNQTNKVNIILFVVTVFTQISFYSLIVKMCFSPEKILSSNTLANKIIAILSLLFWLWFFSSFLIFICVPLNAFKTATLSYLIDTKYSTSSSIEVFSSVCNHFLFAAYLSAVTLSTVGYGDIQPINSYGICSLVTIIIGQMIFIIIFVSILLGEKPAEEK